MEPMHSQEMFETSNISSLKMYITRTSGEAVPLIAADQLPEEIELVGVSRHLTTVEMEDSEWLGVVSSPGSTFSLDRNSLLGELLASHLALATSSIAQRTNSNLYTEKGADSRRVYRAMPIVFTKDKEISSRSNPRAKNLTLAGVTTMTHQDPLFRPLPPSGIEPDYRNKVYCTHWLETKTCKFTQQGCLYKHEWPNDETLRNIGLANLIAKRPDKIRPSIAIGSNSIPISDRVGQKNTTTRTNLQSVGVRPPTSLHLPEDKPEEVSVEPRRVFSNQAQSPSQNSGKLGNLNTYSPLPNTNENRKRPHKANDITDQGAALIDLEARDFHSTSSKEQQYSGHEGAASKLPASLHAINEMPYKHHFELAEDSSPDLADQRERAQSRVDYCSKCCRPQSFCCCYKSNEGKFDSHADNNSNSRYSKSIKLQQTMTAAGYSHGQREPKRVQRRAVERATSHGGFGHRSEYGEAYMDDKQRLGYHRRIGGHYRGGYAARRAKRGTFMPGVF